MLFLFSYSAFLSNSSISYNLLFFYKSCASRIVSIPLQRSRLLHLFPSSSWPFVCCFCWVFLHSILVSLKATLLVPQLISICVLHKREKNIKPVWNTICFLLCKIHHKFTSCHVLVSILPHINFSMEAYTSVIQDRNAPHLGLPCMRGEGHCWEGECDWQTNGPRLFGTCVSPAPVVSWHVYIANHSQIAVGANRHLQLFVWPLPHK